MSIDDIKIKDLKEAAELFAAITNGIHPRATETAATPPPNVGLNTMVGAKVIVRTYSAGVWFGELKEKAGNEVILVNARRLWQWKAKESISLSAVAKYGIDADESIITPAVAYVWLEAIELIPTSCPATHSIEGAPDAVAQ